ncbi:MAG TPA: SIR2 family protein [Rhizomicrobium sp.]
MADELPLLPDVPEGIRDSATRGILVPFVGAGLSLLTGCPGWGQLAKGALHTFLDNGRFTHAQLAQIEHLSSRVKLAIALGMEKETKLSINFEKLLMPTNGYENEMGRKVYGALSKMAKTFITTNYDKWLDSEIILAAADAVRPSKALAVAPTPLSRRVFDEVKDFTPENLNSPGVFHIHGALRRTTGMVMTTSQYLRHYANDHHSANPEQENRLLTFLEYLFKKKTVLFIGYGLEELEILEYVIQKARLPPKDGVRESKHFMIQGYFSHEIELMRSMRSYYLNECGIELIGFRRDEKDWEQLAAVLEDFALRIPARDPMLAQELSEMGDLLDG